jgi:hypothetical protein
MLICFLSACLSKGAPPVRLRKFLLGARLSLGDPERLAFSRGAQRSRRF